jgi:predicted ThiF/HesA family dinucleotide-utilizing enzyme
MAAIAASNTYRVQIAQDSLVDGKTLKVGDYKIELQNNLAVIKQGKQTIEVPAHSESVTKKFATTEIEYINNEIQVIHVGGSRTKIVFDAANATADVGQ